MSKNLVIPFTLLLLLQNCPASFSKDNSAPAESSNSKSGNVATEASMSSWKEEFKKSAKTLKKDNIEEVENQFSKVLKSATASGIDDQIVCLNSIGVLLAKKGFFENAETYLKQGLELAEKHYKPDDPKLARTLKNMGYFYRKQKKYKEAKNYYEKFLAIVEKNYGQDDPKLLWHLDLLSYLSYKVNDPEAKKNYDSRVNKILDAYPQEKDDKALIEQGIKNKKLSLTERLLIRRIQKAETAGAESLPVAKSMTSLARFYEKIGQFNKAIPLWNKAVRIYEKNGMQDDLVVAEGLTSLVRVLKGDKKQNAREKILKIYGKIPQGDPKRIYLAVAYNNEAMTTKNPELVEECYKKATTICDQVRDKLATKSQKMYAAVIYRGYAHFLESKNRKDEAKALIDKASKILAN